MDAVWRRDGGTRRFYLKTRWPDVLRQKQVLNAPRDVINKNVTETILGPRLEIRLENGWRRMSSTL